MRWRLEGDRVCDNEKKPICTVNSNRYDWARNAALIASAPTLVAACQEAMTCLANNQPAKAAVHLTLAVTAAQGTP